MWDQLRAPPRLPGVIASSEGGVRLAHPDGAVAVTRRRDRTGRTGSVLIAHPSPDLYGSDRVLLESVSAFTEVGREVVVALPEPGPLVGALEARGARVVFCPTPILRKSALRPFGLASLALTFLRSLLPSVRLLARERPDLVYVNTVTIPAWLVWGRCLGTPTLCHVHEAEASQPLVLRKLLYAPLLLADRLVVNSEYSGATLTDAWPGLRRRLAVVYNGVPGPAAPVVSPRADRRQVRLLFIGRLSPRKGPQVAVEALGLLLEQRRNVELSLLGAVFPGYEWFEDELRSQAEALGGRVRFLGFRPDVWPVLAEHDVVLVPSLLDEPFGNTAIEAMLAERPLVVSDTSGLKEAAAGFSCARLVPPGDAPAVAEAVGWFLDHWPELLRDAPADRLEAVRRHAPEVYRAAVRRVAGVPELPSTRGQDGPGDE